MTTHRESHFEHGTVYRQPQQRSMELAENAEIRLLTCPRKQGEELRGSLKSYKGFAFVDARVWFENGGEWRPGKGCTFKVREIAQVASALDEASRRAS